MKTAIEKPVTPGGVFDHLMVPQEDEPEFPPSKDPKTMTVQESLEEVDRFLCWNRMTPEEKRAEQEAQRAASHATEQAAEDIPCTMRPERVPDTPQDTVWEDLTDAPQDVVRADVLDTSMGGTFYRQFGLTMAIAIGLSALNALTLSPALCAIFLKPHDEI